MANSELYDDAADLAMFLRADGSDFWADELERAMTGATGSEIFGAVLRALESLLAAPDGVSEENRKRAVQIKRGLRKSLSWWSRLLEHPSPPPPRSLIVPPDPEFQAQLIKRLGRMITILGDRLPSIWLPQAQELLDQEQHGDALKLLCEVLAENRTSLDEVTLVELTEIAGSLGIEPLVVDRLRTRTDDA